MELGTWLTGIRILNFACAVLLIGFQIWFLVELYFQDISIYGLVLRVWATKRVFTC